MNVLNYMSIKEHLTMRSIEFQESEGTITTKCIFCETPEGLRFSAATGDYKCEHCNREGGLIAFLKALGEDVEAFEYKAQSKTSKSLELADLLRSLDTELFLNQYNEAYVAINKNGTNVFSIESKDCDIWIHRECCKKGKSFGSEAIKNAKMILMSEAYEGGVTHNLSVRVAQDQDDNIWYDLGQSAVKIAPDDWYIVDSPPILFQRLKHQQPQVIPVRGDSDLNQLFRLFNLRNEDDKIMMMVWLISNFIPDFPHPILVLFGEHGSAKSTTCKIIKNMVDPSSLLTLPPIKDLSQFIQVVSHHRLACFDNFSSLKDDLSDQICRACSGDGYSKRKLYSNDDDYVYNYQHVIAINGIHNVVNRADLLDRSLLIETSRISDEDRRGEKDIYDEFSKNKPLILGACMDILSKAMRIKPQITLDSRSRMADFTEWGCAIAEAAGIGQDRFLLASSNNRQKQYEEAINASPIGLAVIELLKAEGTGIVKGQSTSILSRLNDTAYRLGLETTHNNFWPKDPKNLWKKLSEIAPVLKVYGIDIRKGRETDRFIEIKDVKKYQDNQQELKECSDIADKLF